MRNKQHQIEQHRRELTDLEEVYRAARDSLRTNTFGHQYGAAHA